MRSFNVQYWFDGFRKSGSLPEWLADSMDDCFGGDIGLTQTTRVCVHQTKVRLLAAAIDAMASDHVIGADEVDAAFVEQGLLACVARHKARWPALTELPMPGFEHAFALHAPNPRDPAFLQCPDPGGEPFEVAEGMRLLPDLGFSVPAHVPASDDAGLAFQLMANAGRLGYIKGRPTTSRPLGQTVAVDVPGRPAWRVRHELGVLLTGIEKVRVGCDLQGSIVFAWLLPFHPNGIPIPRSEQHPLLLDVPSPVRVREDGKVSVFNRPCRIGSGEGPALSTAALALRNWWAASGMPGLATEPTRGAKPSGDDSKTKLTAADLEEAGLDPAPAYMQRPRGKPVSTGDLLALVRGSPLAGGKDALHPLVLSDYAGPETEQIDAQEGAELVIEGEAIGNSTTAFWLDVRVPLPEPHAGADTGTARWRGWHETVERQLDARSKELNRLYAIAKSAWLRRKQPGDMKPSRTATAKSGEFASRWRAEVEMQTDPALWEIAARTWHDRTLSEAQWRSVVDGAVKQAAMQAFEALGGLDDPATMLSGFDLLRMAQGKRNRPA